MTDKTPFAEELVDLLERKLDLHQRAFNKVIEDIQRCPVSALERITGSFQSAIALDVLPKLIEWVRERDGTTELMMEQLAKDAAELGKYPSYSTSPGHNIMQVERVSFYLKLVDELKFLV